MELNVQKVAEYVIDKCYIDRHPVSNLQLNAVLHSIQSAFLNRFKRKCFPDSFEMRLYGPVVPKIYERFCGAGAYDLSLRFPDSRDIFTDEEKMLVDSVIEKSVKDFEEHGTFFAR